MGPSDSDMSKKWAVPESRFEVKNDPTCTKTDFSTCALSREDRIWGKRTTKFSCSHLTVNISRWQASCCAEQAPVSKARGCSVPCYRARKKVYCKGRNQEFILETETWMIWWIYISCNWQSTKKKLCFARLCTGGSDRLKFFYFLFSAAVTKTGCWTTSLVCTDPLQLT